ncbi:hypothetical protein H9P43_004110 [Blastocladiella emersonii ATCC 22665]|nr:hypothetical protein H9P43_004110 [Blastocladiella emersonii ATCC 22665]
MSFSITRHVTNILKVGPRMAWHQMMTLGEVKAGTLIGTDAAGNQYYENTKTELWVRERWVVPAKRNFDPSEIPAEWHMWIHRTDSRTPQELKAQLPQSQWIAPHTANTSGTAASFKPYNTTEPKVEEWAPKVARRGA